LQKGLSPAEQLRGEQEHSLLDRLEGAKTSDERDDLYFQLASLALGRDDPKARDYADKIGEDWLRQRAQAWVDAGLAIKAIQKKKVDPALELARKGELTHIQRVWVLTQAANFDVGGIFGIFTSSDYFRAVQLARDFQGEAPRVNATIAIARAVLNEKGAPAAKTHTSTRN
jgi:hypothetical protein